MSDTSKEDERSEAARPDGEPAVASDAAEASGEPGVASDAAEAGGKPGVAAAAGPVQPTGAEREARPDPPARRQRRGGGAAFGLALVALLLGAAGAVIAGFVWREYRAFGAALTVAADEQRVAIDAADAAIRELAGRLETLERGISEDRDRIAALRVQIGDIPAQIGALSQRIDALQGGPLDGREVWLRAEAEYYLATANAELALTGRADTALTALTLADGLLRELADPALNPVRVAIAEERASLGAVELPDYEGIAFRLAGLASRVPALAMRGGRADDYADQGPPLDDMEPGLGRLFESLKRAVTGIVRIERRDAPPPVLLGPAEQEMVRRELILELQLARIALLRGETGGFRASLAAAAGLLEREFDLQESSVDAALGELRELQSLDIAPALPDISGSLNLLRSITGGAG